ncbi:MAG: glycerophosphodiester phosphodiesterase [Sideroxydans sp.]|nr:glycerophosphodiester phosphodiesterase [Sideroxydans sp.]
MTGQTHTTLVYAHRGANREAAENTRTAFDNALRYAIDGFETDVQLSRDEVPVLWHDRYLNKLGLPDRHIDDFDYEQLRQMDFAQHFPGAQPEGIMSLQDFLAAYRTRCRLLIEIKNRVWETPARRQLKVRRTLELIGAAQDGRVLVSSFHLASLAYAHGIAPGCPLVYNLEPEQGVADVKQVLASHPFLHGVCLHISTLDEAMATLLRAWNKSIAVYTCNSEQEIRRALDLGVDILISDLPQKALQISGEGSAAAAGPPG